METSATPEINKAALDALKDDVQQLKSSIHGHSTLDRHAKPSYAKMAATNSRKLPQKPAEGPAHLAGESLNLVAKVKVSGACQESMGNNARNYSEVCQRGYFKALQDRVWV